MIKPHVGRAAPGLWICTWESPDGVLRSSYAHTWQHAINIALRSRRSSSTPPPEPEKP